MAEPNAETNIVTLDTGPERKRTENPAGTATPSPDNTSSWQAYLFSSAGVHRKPAWGDSVGGRAAIRLVSRGLVGALAFTIGSRYSRAQLTDYNPEDFSTFDKITLDMVRKKPLQLVAKGFDVVFGKPIAAMVRGVSKMRNLSPEAQEIAAWNAVHFRTKGYFHSVVGQPFANGRSLGAEMVGISFDFAMSSIGDATTRNFFQMIDPNIQKSWMVTATGGIPKEGEKAHFSLGKFLTSTGKATWRVLSKNQGEDWAAALPYVYQMKWQRDAMTHLAPNKLKGSKLVFDNGWNGAAFKVNNQGKLVGDYQLAGAVDLHMRFVGYNVYTLMFREGYDAIGAHLKHWKENGYKLNFHLPTEINPLHGLKEAARYVVKSTIKANLYMNPAVIPFWLIRTPQTKWRAAMINPETGSFVNAIAERGDLTSRIEAYLQEKHMPSGAAEIEALKQKLTKTSSKGNTIFQFDTSRKRVQPGAGTHDFIHFDHFAPGEEHLNAQAIPDPFGPHNTDGQIHSPNSKAVYQHFPDTIETAISKNLLRPIGRACEIVAEHTTKLTDRLFPENSRVWNFMAVDGTTMAQPRAERKFSRENYKQFVHTFTDASLAYTPYMFAKSELGLRVDDHPTGGGPGKMDTAIYKMMDNAWALKPGATMGSMKEIWNLVVHGNNHVVSREGTVVNSEAVRAPKAITVPSTIVTAEGRKRELPVDLSRPEAGAEVTSDEATKRTRMRPAIARERQTDWATSMAARNPAQFQDGGQTRH